MSKHARLSPSGAHRWMECPGSVELESHIPDPGSEYAAEGTAAHDLAEVSLIRKTPAATTIKEVEGDWDKYDAEAMARFVQDYLDIVNNRPGDHFVEIPVPIEDWTGEKGATGTSDHIAIDGSTMYVDDLKYGQGVKVYAENNRQAMLYALGAYSLYGFLYSVETIQVGIIQPRLDHVSEWTIAVEDLLAWGATVKTAAERCNEDAAELVPGESQCRFCRAKTRCKARVEANLELAFERFGEIPHPLLLEPGDIAEILPRLKELKAWAAEIAAFAEAEALAGRVVPGYKLVEGRSTRTWIDPEAAAKALRSKGVKVKDLYVKKIIGIGAAEKLLGRNHPTIAAQTHKPPGKPALVPESDKRKALDPEARAAAAFDSPPPSK